VNFTVLTLNTYPRWFVAFRADKHHVRDVNWTFKLNNAWRNAPSLSLHLSLVLLSHIYALYHNPGLGGDDSDYFTSLPLIFLFSGDHFYNVTFLDL
jgi:hypothetical protein